MDAAVDERDRMDTDDAAENGAEVGELRGQIAHTRTEMGETIEAIKEKLSPEHLAEQARETVREATVGRVQAAASVVSEATVRGAGAAADTARSAGATIAGFIRANRLVAALTGAGVAFLWISAWLSSRKSSAG